MLSSSNLVRQQRKIVANVEFMQVRLSIKSVISSFAVFMIEHLNEILRTGHIHGEHRLKLERYANCYNLGIEE